MIRESNTERVHITNTNAWSQMRESRNEGKVKIKRESTWMYPNQINMSSEEGSPSSPLAQAESYTILSAKKSPTLSRSLLTTSASLLSAGLRGTGDFDRGNRVENASWDRTAPSQEARTSGKEFKTHHDGFSQRAVSRNLTFLSDTLRTVSLDKSLPNRVFANTDETPDGTFAGTSTLTGRN